jgi:hypothetical protein
VTSAEDLIKECVEREFDDLFRNMEFYLEWRNDPRRHGKFSLLVNQTPPDFTSASETSDGEQTHRP